MGNPVYQACVEAFYYLDGYDPKKTITVSKGTGWFLGRPTWIWPLRQWIPGERPESPGEQQTEIVWRQLREIATELEEPIELDNVGAVGRLREFGNELARLIDWEAILDGSDEKFRTRGDQKHFPNTLKVWWREDLEASAIGAPQRVAPDRIPPAYGFDLRLRCK